MPHPLERVLSTIPETFFRRLVEETDAGFVKAWRLVKNNFPDSSESERLNILGQMRHAFCEEAFRAAARNAGLSAEVRPTTPAGGCYTHVFYQDLHLIRSNVQVHCGPPRPTRFRNDWATINGWLDPLQLDLLREERPASSKRPLWDDHRHGQRTVRRSDRPRLHRFRDSTLRPVGMGVSRINPEAS